MFDLMDILCGRAEKVCIGKLYKGEPIEANAISFDYEYLDPTSRTYRMIYGNLYAGQSCDATIKTKVNLNFKIDSYVKLQDGNIYTIISVDKDMQSASKQAYRYFKEPAGLEKTIRLSQVENPFELV